ncbi:MAG TPA: DUF664 domain-containing protein [Candidatus Saccharimonadales bacterium]|nr:DUF664 domain-containing protein [Candidatus Saccharimonadales bacterium]
MIANELIQDAFYRIKEIVHQTVEGTSIDELSFRPAKSANSIAWLVWHLTRIQDDHVSAMADGNQIWLKQWHEQFSLPFNAEDTGYGHSPEDVGRVTVEAKLLLGYYDAVHDKTIKFTQRLNEKDYKKVVDKRWDPPVTLAARLISVISDDLQHAGQAAYIRGLSRGLISN